MRKLGQHPVDRVFDSRLSGAEMPVPGKLWSQISSELEKDQLRRKLFWYRSMAVASVALLIGLGTWMLVQPTFQTREFAGAQKVSRQTNLPAFAERQCRTAYVQLWNSIQLKPAVPSKPGTNQSSTDLNVVVTPMVVPGDDRFVVKDAIADHVKEALQNAPLKLELLRLEISSRTPSLLGPVIADRERSLPTAEVTDGKPLDRLLTNHNRKEKEFNYVVEEGDDDKAGKRRRWELGAGFSPDMSFASTTPVQQLSRSSSSLADDPTQANTNRLSPVMAYAAVVRTSVEFDDRWSLRTGLSFMNRQTSTAADFTASGKNTTTYQSNLDLYSLELPVSVKYNVLHEDDFDYYVTTGVSGNFFLHYDNYLQASDGKIASRRSSTANEVFKPSQASLLLSTGLRYRLLDRLSLQLEPGIRYGVLRNEYAFSQSRPVSTSLLSGLTYHF